jgi:copper transport protein
VRRLGLAALAAAVALALPASALAHATLKATSPSPRERLDTAPRLVSLRFDQAVTLIPNAIRVYDAHGRIRSLAAQISRDGHTVFARLRPLQRGGYTVRWQTLSGDGHIGSGVLTFGVRAAAPEPTQAYGASGPTTAEDLVRWLYFVGLALLLGGLAFRLLVVRGPVPHAFERRFYLVTGIGVVGILEIGIVAFLLRAQDALQLPLARFLYGDLSTIASTRFGEAFIAMTLGYAVVSALLFLAWLLERRVLLWAAFLLGLLLASGLSLSGHSAVDRGSSKWSELADWVHLSAAALWAGGVVMLLVVFLTAPGLRRAAFVGFARLAPLLIALLLAAGIYLSVLRLPSVSDLWQTGYGQVLIVKLSLVALALLWGAVHHFLVEPRLDRPGVLARVPRSLVGESAVGIAVLLVAAILVNSKPPAPVPTSPAQAERASAARPSR